MENNKVFKSDLAKSISTEFGVSLKSANDIVSYTLDEITKELLAGKTVSLSHFGSFSTQVRKSRKGVNPRTREIMQIPSSKVVSFKASSILKTKLNQ